MAHLEKADDLLLVSVLIAYSHDRSEEQPYRSDRARTLAYEIAAQYELDVVDALNELACLEAEGKA